MHPKNFSVSQNFSVSPKKVFCTAPKSGTLDAPSVSLEHNASCAPENGFQQTRVVHTDSRRLCPTQWSTSDFLSECCKLIRCLLSALCQFILQLHVLSGQPLQSSRELLMHCSHRIFCHLRVCGTSCLSNDSGPSTNTGSSSETSRPQRKPLHQWSSALRNFSHGVQLREVLIVPPAPSQHGFQLESVRSLRQLRFHDKRISEMTGSFETHMT